MALDVGMSHPDLFAGVSTMGAGPEKFSELYWHNAQYLPFYIVNGERVGKILDTTHLQFERWIGQRFPTLWVQYKAAAGCKPNGLAARCRSSSSGCASNAAPFL